MSYNMILTEDKKERIVDMFRPQLENISKDAVKFAEEIIDDDPSATKKYSEWGIKKLIDTVRNPTWLFSNSSPNAISTIIRKRIRMYHDIVDKLSSDKVTSMFNFLSLDGHFSSEKTEQKIKSKPKDITSFDDLHDLDYFIDQYEQYISKIDDEKNIKKQAEKVYENDRFLIVRPLSHKASCYYGANTKWCTTTKENDYYFNNYTSRGKLYYIIDKKSNDGTYGKMALLVPHGKGSPEIYNQQDTAETYNFLLTRFSPIKDKILELIEKSDDYETLKKVKENPKISMYETLNSEYFDRFIGEQVVFNFKNNIEEFLTFFRPDVGDDTLNYYNWMYQNPNGDFFYEYGKFDDDMSEGYPLYYLNEEHISTLKSIIEITQPQLLSFFDGNEIDRDNLDKIAKFIKDSLPKLYDSFATIYSEAEDTSQHKGFVNYAQSEICNIYDDIGLKKMEDSDCFGQYVITIDQLLEYYNDDLNYNKKLSAEKVIENQVISNLNLDSSPYDNSFEYRDDDEFRYIFDDTMQKYLDKELERLEDYDSTVEDTKQYRRMVNYIDKKFGFSKPNLIKTSEEESMIVFDGVDPKTNKINFTLIQNNKSKKGTAKLETIIKLLNNYTLFDPF